MFEFFDNLEKRRAFKKALQEVNDEILDSQGVAVPSTMKKHTTDRTVSRVYHDMSGEKKKVEEPEVTTTAFRKSNPLRKPETTAVDLKNFKDWRNIVANESKEKQNPFDSRRSRYNPFAEDKDDVLGKNNFSSNKTTTQSGIEALSKPADSSNKDLSFDTYVKEKNKAGNNRQSSIEDIMNRIERFNKRMSDAQNNQQMQSTIINETKKEDKLDDTFVVSTNVNDPEIKNKELKKDEKLTIEVVDFSNKNESEAPKKKTSGTKKTRGKNKKRFDADVIHSVDWK